MALTVQLRGSMYSHLLAEVFEAIMHLVKDRIRVYRHKKLKAKLKKIHKI